MELATEEKLINAVREYPELYDCKHRFYYDIAHRDRLWEKIAESLNEEIVAVKKRWTCLRDCYRKSLKKRKNRDGKAPFREFRYEKELSFLHDYFWYGKNRTDQTDDDELAASERSLQDSDFDVVGDLTNDDQDPFEETETFFVKSEPVVIETGVERQTPYVKKQKMFHTATSSTPCAVPSGHSGSPGVVGGGDRDPPSDHIAAFFSYIEHTVRSFPPMLQVEAKSRFSQVLTELEMKNLKSQM